jgi:hypothetical protein
MSRILTGIFALLLTLGGISAAPVSRIDARRDSSCIVWIAEEELQQVSAAAQPSRPSLKLSEYRGRAIVLAPDFTLFQRPPPPAL